MGVVSTPGLYQVFSIGDLQAMSFDLGGALRAIFDTLPLAIFVFNQNLQIVSYNPEAMKLADANPDKIDRHLCGEVLRCFHELHSPEQCGMTKACSLCTIRHALLEPLNNGNGTRQMTAMRVVKNGKSYETFFRVSTAVLHHDSDDYVLLVLDDISSSMKAGSAIAICSGCRKLRFGDQKWQDLEDYISSHTAACYTHGICPDCMKRLYPELFTADAE
jgi:PAS domain-containing protein